MPLDPPDGEKTLQLLTSRYDQREWRKKIEKTLSLPPSGFLDDTQRKVFLYLKIGLQAYKSRRADSPSWIVGGFATREVIDRALYNPTVVDPSLTKEQIAWLGVDPGPEVNEAWWEDMLVKWFEEPEDIEALEAASETDEVGEIVQEPATQESQPTEHSP
ncbi:MAG: hypothetical protein GKS05_01040 [Nitrospirales bacterium]|nr:hypothetical protein [Nitrospirales bacterium]